jgi:cell division protease FtsH
MSSDKNFSDETAKLIDQEVKTLVMGGYNRATELLQNNRDILENLSQALLERETLNAIEVNNIVDGKSDIDTDTSDGKSQEIKPEVPVEKLKTKTDPEEGLLGGGMPDPTPA